MLPTDVPVGHCFAATGVYIMALLKGNAGTNITQATISSISVKVFDITRGANTQISTTLAPVVASAVFDTPQAPGTDPRWTKDSTGYNFGYFVPATYFPSGGEVYKVQATFTPTVGEAFKAAWKINTDEWLS